MKLSILIEPPTIEGRDRLWSVYDDGGELTWVLERAIKVEDVDTGRELRIPKGYEWDMATGATDFPRVGIATVIHDWVCQYAEWSYPANEKINAAEAAQILHLALWWSIKRYRRWWLVVLIPTWVPATYLWGCKKAKANGWW